MNPLLLTDGYKVDHKRQYPEGTTLVYSNWTPRKSRIDGIDEVVFLAYNISSRNMSLKNSIQTSLTDLKKKFQKNTLEGSIIT